MKIRCDLIDSEFESDGAPRRIVSLTSGATEALAEIGCGDRLVGVSPYCARYVEQLDAPVVCDYVTADVEALRRLEPDLVLATVGVQRPLALRLAAAGLPVYALPLPSNRFAILDNIITIGALAGRLGPARALARRCEARCARVQARRPDRRPRVYAEMWFGRHARMCGGRGFMHDLMELAGGEPVFGDHPAGYLPLDLEAARAAAPDIMILFQEPEYPVEAEALLAERGWDHLTIDRVVPSTVDKGRNLIHDGPSFCDTAEWLAAEIAAPDA